MGTFVSRTCSFTASLQRMTWIATLLCAVSAVAHMVLVVPRLREPELAPGDPAPLYASLPTARRVLLLGATVLLLTQTLHLVPENQLAPWLGYFGAGAALATVDLLTTWLPRTLNTICAAQVGLGLVWVALTDWATALTALAGGAAALTLFHLVWRFSTTFGYGDVRLAGIVGTIGALNGLQGWLLAMVCGTLLGAIWGLIHSIHRKRHPGASYFAYGPALWLGPVAALVVSGW